MVVRWWWWWWRLEAYSGGDGRNTNKGKVILRSIQIIQYSMITVPGKYYPSLARVSSLGNIPQNSGGGGSDDDVFPQPALGQLSVNSRSALFFSQTHYLC